MIQFELSNNTFATWPGDSNRFSILVDRGIPIRSNGGKTYNSVHVVSWEEVPDREETDEE